MAFANRRKAWAYLQDQLPTTHPIVADIVDLEAAKLNFDGITYAKGASVLKQLVAYVGRDAFFDGIRRYFRAHAFGNTTLDGSAHRTVRRRRAATWTSWARAWLQTTGVSALSLQRGADGAPRSCSPTRARTGSRSGIYDFDDAGDLVRTERRRTRPHRAPHPVDLPDAPLCCSTTPT